MKLAKKNKLAPRPTGGSDPKKFTDNDLLKLLKDNPSMTQRELAEKLNVVHSSIYKRLKKLNISYKKKLRSTVKEMKMKGKCIKQF